MNRGVRAASMAGLLLAGAAGAEAPRERFGAGGYFRIMTRPDFQGGDSKLGFWNLYGRLLNEGPYGALELRLDLLQNAPGRNDPWATVHTKVEGASFANAERQGGRLDQFRVSQLYVQAGNVLLDRVTWQLGTLESYFGDLGLYDARPAQVFSDTLGLSARYGGERLELLLGVGDSGFGIRGAAYDAIPTAGGTVRIRTEHFEVGGGGQFSYEPKVAGNRSAPYVTPNVRYEDFLRHEVVAHFLEEHPGQEDLFPRPQATDSRSWKLVGYLGFGKFGPLKWNNLFVNYLRRHPDASYVESLGGRDYTIYLADLTDERHEVNAGDELMVTLVPEWLDLALAGLFGYHFNPDNRLAPGDDNRRFYSGVLRLQLYVLPTVHLLAETSLAREVSLNGNLYREHVDSVFQNTGGLTDSRGFEMGDSRIRNTWQGKAGVVLNPTGPGIYARPSLRLLYGLQYSSQQAAYGSGFVESLDQYNVFTGPERHWHSVVALEAEAWF